MRRQILIALALFAAGAAGTAPVRAQEDLSKQLEVTRAYTPRVGQATKLPIVPDMTDTVRLRPEISYRITSTASATSFTTRLYEAAVVNAAPLEVRRPFYIRAGVGAPFSTVFDLYYTPRMRAGSAFGIFANHSGSYSKIMNDLGVEANATEMTNGAGAWFSRQRSRYSLEADLAYDNRLYNPYGVADIDHDPASSLPQTRGFVYDRRMHRFTLGLAKARVSFGDNFTDLSRFNFRVGAEAGYGWLNGENQINLDLRLTTAKMFGEGKHGFEAVLAERGVICPGNMNAWVPGAVTVTFAPRYLFASGVWRLRAGIDARYVYQSSRVDASTNNYNDYYQDYFGFAPSLEARANLAGGAFVPFASYTSRIVDGDLEALSRRNPYVQRSGTTAWINDARIGFEGDLGDVFSYEIAGGVSLMRDYQLFVGTQLITLRDVDSATGVDYPPMWFAPEPVDGACFTAGAELALHNLGGFGARLYGNWNKFDFSGTYLNFTPVGDLPRYDAGLELSYAWRDRFSLRLGAEFIGEREYLVSGGTLDGQPLYTTGSIAPVIDVTFGAEARVVRDLWVFIEGENLANQELYPYPHYKGLGASVMGGIKVVF